ncbi:MAG: hypothetical protein FD180_894 [Planctomycetota bacterium]|nr:MAG: hypothetical protein FD180_894 [Planctomycetota bacterium]
MTRAVFTSAFWLAMGGVAGLLAFILLFSALIYVISLFDHDARKSASDPTSQRAAR